jgi:cytoskeletal protein CcmA (bactofilin family)
MALFAQSPRKDDLATKPEMKSDAPHPAESAPPPPAPRRVEESTGRPSVGRAPDSVLSSGLTIEGKIEGSGNVRVAGKFKGNINVQGEFTVEPGASVHGEIRADAILVGGEVRGQIVASSRVELKESGTLVGDLKAGSLIVAAGSRMRGKVEFGWKEGEIDEGASTDGGGQAPRR